MILPQVFAAGFPRCGTTWIARMLNQHPEIHAPMKKHPKYPYLVKKEIHYFNKCPSNLNEPDSENLGFKRNITDYTHFFAYDKINIDFSICSAYDPGAAERIKEILGNVKILFFIRNKKDHKESLKVLIREEPKDYLIEIAPVLEHYMKWFSEVKVINLEDTKENPREILKKILMFIGVKDIDFKFDLSGSKHSKEEILKYNG